MLATRRPALTLLLAITTTAAVTQDSADRLRTDAARVRKVLKKVTWGAVDVENGKTTGKQYTLNFTSDTRLTLYSHYRDVKTLTAFNGTYEIRPSAQNVVLRATLKQKHLYDENGKNLVGGRGWLPVDHVLTFVLSKTDVESALSGRGDSISIRFERGPKVLGRQWRPGESQVFLMFDKD